MPLIATPGGSAALPAVPGGPVTVTGMTNTAAPRIVTLALGGTPAVTVSPAAQVWTALGVTLTVPTDLESGQWTLTVVAGGVTDSTPLFLAYPDLPPQIALIVPPIVVSEAPFEVIGVGFGSKPAIRLSGTMGMEGYDTSPGVLSPHHVRGHAPTIRALQEHDDYRPSAQKLVVQVTVVNTDGAQPRESPPMPITILLPLPAPGVARVVGDLLYFGNPVATSEFGGKLPGIDDSEWLGGPKRRATSEIGGEVRQYDADPSVDIVAALAKLKTATNATARSAALDDLDDIRIRGSVLPIAEDRGNPPDPKAPTTHAWHEEWVVVSLAGTKTDRGYVVLWRDDLPSPPQPYLRLPALTCNALDLKALLQDYLTIVPTAPGAVLPAGTPVTVKTLPGPRINPLLGDFISQHAGALKFEVTVTKDGDPATKGRALPGSSPLDSLSTNLDAKVICQCDVVPLEGYSPLTGTQWRLRVSAQIDLASLCSSAIRLDDLINQTFVQQPLPVPTAALLFEDDGLGGDAIVWLPANTAVVGLAGLQVDERNGSNVVSSTVATFTSAINGLMTACDVLEAVGILPPSAPSSAARAVVRGAMNSLSTAQISVAVWSADSIPDFGHIKRDSGKDFNDILSSLLFLSAPVGQHIKMWQHYYYGAWFQLQMPSGQTVAGVQTFRNVPDGMADVSNAFVAGGLFDNNKAINDIVTSARWSRDGTF